MIPRTNSKAKQRKKKATRIVLMLSVLAIALAAINIYNLHFVKPNKSHALLSQKAIKVHAKYGDYALSLPKVGLVSKANEMIKELDKDLLFSGRNHLLLDNVRLAIEVFDLSVLEWGYSGQSQFSGLRSKNVTISMLHEPVINHDSNMKKEEGLRDLNFISKIVVTVGQETKSYLYESTGILITLEKEEEGKSI